MILNNEYEAYFPDRKVLDEASALLFAVYGIEPKKVTDMTWREISEKVKDAENKITWIQIYKFRSLLESKPKTLWQRIISKIKI